QCLVLDEPVALDRLGPLAADRREQEDRQQRSDRRETSRGCRSGEPEAMPIRRAHCFSNDEIPGARTRFGGSAGWCGENCGGEIAPRQPRIPQNPPARTAAFYRTTDRIGWIGGRAGTASKLAGYTKRTARELSEMGVSPKTSPLQSVPTPAWNSIPGTVWSRARSASCSSS